MAELTGQLEQMTRYLEDRGRQDEAAGREDPQLAEQEATPATPATALAAIESQLLKFADDLSTLYRVIFAMERRFEVAEAQVGELLVEALHMRDSQLYDHSRRVAQMADLIAAGLRMSPDRRQVVRLGALLHDIGKLARVAEDPAQPSRLYQHPLVGKRLLDGVKSLEPLIPCVLLHHERVDGKGYPRGLRRFDIPLAARTVAAANVFDHLVFPPPPRLPVPIRLALLDLQQQADRKLDEQCVDVLVVAARRGLVEKVLKRGGYATNG